MKAIELIDRLCAVVEAQARIIRTQAMVIEEQRAIDDEVKRELETQRSAVNQKIELAGVGLTILEHKEE